MNPKSYLKIFSVCLSLLFISRTTHAQTTVKIGGKEFTISGFSNDTLSRKESYVKEDSLLITHKFIKPLSKSKEEFEARCFLKNVKISEYFTMIVLKGSKHSLSAEIFDCQYVYLLGDGAPGIKIDDHASISVQRKRNKIDLGKDQVFSKLIEAGLFIYPDKKAFKGGNTPTMQDDNHSDFMVEVKLNGRYHSFRYDPDLLEADPENQKLKAGKTIINAFALLAKMRRLI